MLYGQRCSSLAIASFFFGVACEAADFIALPRETGFWKRFELPFELYVIAFCGTALLPENLRPSPDGGWIGVVGSRLTTISAIFGLCVLGLLKPRKWHLAGFCVCAAGFFTFFIEETRWVNRLEAKDENIVS